MNPQVKDYIGKYPNEVTAQFLRLRNLIFDSVSGEITETMWARLPSYYVGENFVRLIPFRDHINVEASAVAACREALAGYKLTSKGMLQIFVNQQIPDTILPRIFWETLGEGAETAEREKPL